MGLAVRDALHWANAIVRTAPMAPDPDERFVAKALADSAPAGRRKGVVGTAMAGRASLGLSEAPELDDIRNSR
jgi:hypothetical protein